MQTHVPSIVGGIQHTILLENEFIESNLQPDIMDQTNSTTTTCGNNYCGSIQSGIMCSDEDIARCLSPSNPPRSPKNHIGFSVNYRDSVNNKNKNKNKKTVVEINYENYYKSGFELVNYKIPELKEAAKKYRLHISGTKPLLIARLSLYFNQMRKSIIVQRFFRGWMVRQLIRLRGPAIKNRSICVNDTDFVSMEPLNEIDSLYFFSYTDSKKFTYGFNILSLIQMIKTQNQKYNPYNREKLDQTVIEKIISLYNVTKILYPEFKNETENAMRPAPVRNNHLSHRPRVINNNIAPVHYGGGNNHTTTLRYQHASVESRNLLIRILEIRSNTIEHRVQNLFMTIDQLGNYTQSYWFSNLDVRQYNRLFRAFDEVWNYRSQLSADVKSKICQFNGAFDGVLLRSGDGYNYDNLKNMCLTVFENMVYSGIDEEHRKLGTFHALSALTLVSHDARNALPWLYESIAY